MKKAILLTLILGSKLAYVFNADPSVVAAFENNDESFVKVLLASSSKHLLSKYNGMPLPTFLNTLPASDAIKQLVADFYLFYMIQNGSIEDIENVINGRPFEIKGEGYDALVPANVDAINHINGSTPAMLASLGGNPDIVRLLINNGADSGPTARDNNGNTLLHYAAQLGQDNTLSLLIDSELYPSADPINNIGETPLMFAAQYGAKSPIEKLIHAGANKALINRQGHNALWYLDNGIYHANMYLHERNLDGTVKRVEDGSLSIVEDPVLAHQEIVDMLTP